MDTAQINIWISYLSITWLSIVSVWLMLKFKTFPNYIKYFSIYWLLETITEISAVTLANFGQSNLFVLHISTLLEFIVLAIYFNSIITLLGGDAIKTIFTILFAMFIIFNSLYVQPYDTFNSISYSLTGLIYILFCLQILYLSLGRSNEEEGMPFIRIMAICLLIYYSISLIIILFSNELLDLESDKDIILWIIRAIIILITKIIVGYNLISMINHSPNFKSALNGN